MSDNGAGFEAAFAGKFFKMFERLHGDDVPGTGIGLAIVERIVTRHGGRVWPEGEAGHRACFSFALPAQPDPGFPSSAGPALAPSAQSRFP